MKIYKYRACQTPEQRQWAEEILSDHLFYFADGRKLNDPMEGYFRYYPDSHPSFEIEDILAGKDLHGICSFSLTCDEILLWTHYADNHRGICIEIEVDENVLSGVLFRKVNYMSRIPWLTRLKGGSQKPHYEQGSSDTQNDSIVMKILCSKISKWSYEKEIRAFCDGKGKKHKLGTITKVILGVRADSDIRCLVEKHINLSRICPAKINFNTNKIIVKDADQSQ